MNKNSLIKARELIVNLLMNSKINGSDKAQLIMDIVMFLNEESYDKNVKAIRKVKYKK